MLTARMKESLSIKASSHNALMSRARHSEHESDSVIQGVRMGWEVGINEELQAMAVEKKRPFARLMYI
jgi:hypothetical protein